MSDIKVRVLLVLGAVKKIRKAFPEKTDGWIFDGLQKAMDNTDYTFYNFPIGHLDGLLYYEFGIGDEPA